MNKIIYTAMVVGAAGSQGSKRLVRSKKTNEPIMIEATKTSRTWRREMIESMRKDKPTEPLIDAVMIHVRIFVARPKTHYKKDGSLKRTAHKYPALKTRDPDKTIRAIGDAAKIAGWVVDDGIISWHAVKVYTEDIAMPARVEVKAYSMEQWGEYFLEEITQRAKEKIDNEQPPRIQLLSGLYNEVIR